MDCEKDNMTVKRLGQNGYRLIWQLCDIVKGIN